MNSSTLFLYKRLFAASALPIGLVLGLVFFSSCQKKHKPSFIVIAADRLSFNAFSCNEEKNNPQSGLSALCQESIRYSNAYTTSTQPAAAMGSLLTGSYPYQHSLHRGFDRLRPDIPLLQEYFKKQNYRTAFWSAGPGVLKKTGLARGFDLFDDSTFIGKPNYSVSFKEQTSLFRKWVDESSDPFFAVIYNSDLESFDEEENHQSKIEVFDERLGQFIRELKNDGLWEQNYVIVTGLQGRSEYGRSGETSFSNLHSENVNIAFFIKTPRQKGDEGVNLKIDSLSSLADFGYSLSKIIESHLPEPTEEIFPLSDYSKLWTENQLSGPVHSTKKLVESADTWTQDRRLKLATLFGNYIYIAGTEAALFNRLTDGLETINLAKTSESIVDENKFQTDILRKKTNSQMWDGPGEEKIKLIEYNRLYWSVFNQRDVLFESEKHRLAQHKKAQPISSLLIYYLNAKKEKDLLYDEARRISYNLAVENIWGLWNETKVWPQPAVKIENQ